LAFLSSSIAFVSDGHGCMYILSIPESGPATLCGTYELPTSSDVPTNTSTPFRIHSVVEVSSSSVTVLLSSKSFAAHSEPSNTRLKSRREGTLIQFDIWAVRFSLPLPQSQDYEIPRPMNILWHRRGEHVPISTEYDSSRQAHLLIGGSVYRPMEKPAPPSYQPSQDELAPIPRPDENLDETVNGPTKPPPYSWTQTNDEVTLAFPLPSSTDKSHIKVSFSSRTLTIHVQTDDTSSPITAPTLPLPHYSMKQLWDVIQPSTCFWTWDRKAEHSFGLLTLHLDKQNDGTRWMQVFASAGTSTSPQDDADTEVPETLDPSELYNIRESLEKYTSSLRDGEDVSGLGLGRGVPSLGQGEIDDEVDTVIGRQAFITWVPVTADAPSPEGDMDEMPFGLLSTSVPGINPSEISIIVKNSIDGVVFSLPSNPPLSPPTWAHTSTFSALAFVLASKQDTRFTYHVPSKAVLAFENGTKDRGGNVYIYRSSVHMGEKWAKQAVLKVGDGESGSLLGVGAVRTSRGGYVLLCLCEAKLVVIDVQDIL
jgi:CS domain